MDVSSRMPIGDVSHVIGEVDQPLVEKTIPQVLYDTAKRFPNRDAAVFSMQGIRRTYQEFSDDVDRLAAGLITLGFQKNDRIGIWSPNRYEWLLTQFATARIGVILVNINPAYRTHELEYALNKVGCTGLITAPAFKTSDYAGMLVDLAPELKTSEPGELKSQRFPHLSTVICLGDDTPAGMIPFASVTGDPAALPPLDALDRNDPINIQFTSGTTGQPKGATLTHRNIVNNAWFVGDALVLSEQDRLCIPVPFYHCFGMVMGTLGSVLRGTAMIVPGEGFEAAATLKTVSDEKCTALYGVPTMFVNMLEHPNFASFDLSTLRTGIMAGAPCPIEVMRAVQTKMNMTEVTIAYGMTETSPVSFQSNVDDPTEKRVTSVGRIHPHVEVKIVDENGVPVPVGSQGELWTKGYSVMKGYWADDEKTADALDAEGWMHTGDLARMDEEGYVNITGRVKDMIVRGGENIYPREVEEFLYTHPAVSQVQVFGVPDQKFGEISCAWILKKPGATVDEAEIRAFCKEHIAYYKVPAHVRFVDEIPMTVTGKPQKFVMRDTMMEDLGLKELVTA
ncbi:AMP-binding protein [Litoreibacter roseus]|uniref:3-methylmercaptopropionyl-CoA ligase n=1 Tax=Litoreibacter roseus TaxID=2601869 RepID=A0A6N6JDV0_9RHOB|nr:AMP-binding protein [Litoreibacter roseus]GFE64386.1 AMP-binding protein [Litoreibacter roseus]